MMPAAENDVELSAPGTVPAVRLSKKRRCARILCNCCLHIAEPAIEFRADQRIGELALHVRRALAVALTRVEVVAVARAMAKNGEVPSFNELAKKAEVGVGRLHVRDEELAQLGLGGHALLHGHALALLEEHQHRDVLHSLGLGQGAVLLDVQLGDGQPARVVLGEFVQDGREPIAGATPIGPEVRPGRCATLAPASMAGAAITWIRG
jgi:hypothetical protein